jgi:hypothetical protein
MSPANGIPEAPPQMTAEMWSAMQAAARAAGLNVAPPEDEKTPTAPTLELTKGWRVLGLELGAMLRQRNIFLRAGVLGRVHETSGEWQTFDAKNFAGWVEEYVAFRWKGEKAKLSAEQAAMLMAQFTFRDQIRELRGVQTVSLPVLDEKGRVRFLQKGYDAPTCIFTVPTLEYEQDWPVDRAVEFLKGTFRFFPWMRASDAELEEVDGKMVLNLQRNRSFAVHLAAMLGMYCREMFPAGTLRPMALWVANQEGSGKTVLAQSTIVPVFGLFPPAPMPKNDDELRKGLNAAALAYRPFLFFDDLPFLKSNHLNRFITSPRHGDRRMGGDDVFDVPAVTQVFATGNNLKGSRDIALRSLVVELFYGGDLSKRELPAVEMDAAWMAKPENRQAFLAAMCALVKHWDRRAEQGEAFAGLLDGIKGMPRFATFTKVVSAIVRAACFADPLSAPLMPLDEDVDEMRQLLIEAATGSEWDRRWSREELVTLAREKELCEDLVGVAGDKALDAASSKRFGYRMRAFRGRELVDNKGRAFTFGHYKCSTGATYPITFAS